MTKTKTDSPIFQKFCVDDCWDVCDWIFFAFLKIGKPILELQKQPQNLILKNKNWAFFFVWEINPSNGMKKENNFQKCKENWFCAMFFRCVWKWSKKLLNCVRMLNYVRMWISYMLMMAFFLSYRCDICPRDDSSLLNGSPASVARARY